MIGAIVMSANISCCWAHQAIASCHAGRRAECMLHPPLPDEPDLTFYVAQGFYFEVDRDFHSPYISRYTSERVDRLKRYKPYWHVEKSFNDGI